LNAPLVVNPPICHKESDFSGHGGVWGPNVARFADWWCSKYRLDMTMVHVWGDSLYLGPGPEVYWGLWVDEVEVTHYYSVRWVEGCITTVARQNVVYPLHPFGVWSETPACRDVLYSSYSSCNNGGVGGFTQVGCLMYEYTGGLPFDKTPHFHTPPYQTPLPPSPLPSPPLMPAPPLNGVALDLGPRECFKEADVPGHHSVGDNEITELAHEFCDQNGPWHGKQDHISAKDTPFTGWYTDSQGTNYYFSVFWAKKCVTALDKQNIETPLHDKAPSCMKLMQDNYFGCNNGGVGGKIQAGCVVYKFVGGLDSKPKDSPMDSPKDSESGPPSNGDCGVTCWRKRLRLAF
jgi:hypothetical protein